MSEPTSDPAVLLGEMATLREHTRAQLRAYWFPLLLFGLLIVGAVRTYTPLVVGGPADGQLYPDTLAPWHYWVPALLLGSLLTAGWYRWRGGRVGAEGRVLPAIAAGALAVVGFWLVRRTGIHWLWHVYVPQGYDYLALEVVAVGLLALAWIERSRYLAAVAVLFAVTAAVVNYVGSLNDYLTWTGFDPYAHPGQQRYDALPGLLLPAAVLLVGGLAAAARALLSRARRDAR
jgi:hypothetical protein